MLPILKVNHSHLIAKGCVMEDNDDDQPVFLEPLNIGLLYYYLCFLQKHQRLVPLFPINVM